MFNSDRPCIFCDQCGTRYLTAAERASGVNGWNPLAGKRHRAGPVRSEAARHGWTYDKSRKRRDLCHACSATAEPRPQHEEENE